MIERPRNLRRDVADWVVKAEEDWLAARTIDGAIIPNVVCFHCEQCAEKYLKALLTLHDEPPPRSHDLGLLLGSAIEHMPDLARYAAPPGILSRKPTSRRPQLALPQPTEFESSAGPCFTLSRLPVKPDSEPRTVRATCRVKATTRPRARPAATSAPARNEQVT